jgi:hypothetical protein
MPGAARLHDSWKSRRSTTRRTRSPRCWCWYPPPAHGDQFRRRLVERARAVFHLDVLTLNQFARRQVGARILPPDVAAELLASITRQRAAGDGAASRLRRSRTPADFTHSCGPPLRTWWRMPSTRPPCSRRRARRPAWTCVRWRRCTRNTGQPSIDAGSMTPGRRRMWPPRSSMVVWVCRRGYWWTGCNSCAVAR